VFFVNLETTVNKNKQPRKPELQICFKRNSDGTAAGSKRNIYTHGCIRFETFRCDANETFLHKKKSTKKKKQQKTPFYSFSNLMFSGFSEHLQGIDAVPAKKEQG
jgi:hypothetical protein